MRRKTETNEASYAALASRDLYDDMPARAALEKRMRERGVELNPGFAVTDANWSFPEFDDPFGGDKNGPVRFVVKMRRV